MNYRPMIYVACLAAYNSGILHGQWIDAAQEPEEITEQVQEMLKKSPVENAEEWAIHDVDGFEGIKIDEWEPFCYVSAVAKMLTCTNEFTPCEIAELFNLLNVDDPEIVIEYIQDNYQGEFQDLGHWAEYILEETDSLNEVPKELRSYIDFDGYGRDAELNGDIIAVQSSTGKQHVFWSR